MHHIQINKSEHGAEADISRKSGKPEQAENTNVQNEGVPLFLQPQLPQLLQRQVMEDEEEELQASPDVSQIDRQTVEADDLQLEPESGRIQAKLSVSQPDDPYEKEADDVADQVMAMPEGNKIQRQPLYEDDEEESVQTKGELSHLSRQMEGEEEEELQTKAIDERITPLNKQSSQRQPMEEEEEELQPRRIENIIQRQGEEEKENLQAKTSSNNNSYAPNHVSQHVRNLDGSGQALPGNTQQFFESRFGQDLSRVRIHTDVQSAESARDIQAKAYTTGRNIVFAPGYYNPVSTDGKHLLAHELTHVLQQTGTSKKIQRECAADPQFRRTHSYWSWIDNKILSWQQISLNKIRFWLHSVLIASNRSRTSQLSTRLSRSERALATAESNSTNVGLAFAGNMLWVIAGLGPQKPLIMAIQIGGALIASLSSINFDESRPVNTPEFLDQLGGLDNLVRQIERAIPGSLAHAVREKRRLASEGLCQLAANRSAGPDAIYQNLFRATFPELPDTVAQSQGPASATQPSRPIIRGQEGSTPGAQTQQPGVPSLTIPEPVSADFLTAVETYIMQRLQAYMQRVANEARASLRGRQTALQRISRGRSSESELREVMGLVGISETADAMAASITGGTGDVHANRLFDRIQSSLDYDAYKVRMAAILALIRVTRDGRVSRELALPELIRKLDDDEDLVRVIAAHGLAQLGAVIAIPAIYRTLRSIDDERKKQLIRTALEQLTGHASRQ